MNLVYKNEKPRKSPAGFGDPEGRDIGTYPDSGHGPPWVTEHHRSVQHVRNYHPQASSFSNFFRLLTEDRLIGARR
jgi:hypothetical protein